MDHKHVEKIVSEFAERLMEHADSVRIFVTGRGDGSNTKSYTTGRGNWHAQRGQIATWVRQEDERDREELRMEFHDEGGDEDFKNA